VEMFPQGDKGKTRDRVAAAIGLGSGRTYDKALKVWEAAKARKSGRVGNVWAKGFDSFYRQ